MTAVEFLRVKELLGDTERYMIITHKGPIDLTDLLTEFAAFATLEPVKKSIKKDAKNVG
jgi:hypothetical protein